MRTWRMMPSIPRIQAFRLWFASWSSLTANSRKNKSIGPWSRTSRRRRNAPVVEQVEEIPALMKLNLAWGNLFSIQSIMIGRYPSISVIEPPIKATVAGFPLSKEMRALLRVPRTVIFFSSKPKLGKHIVRQNSKYRRGFFLIIVMAEKKVRTWQVR